jgi:hypothetical protein
VILPPLVFPALTYYEHLQIADKKRLIKLAQAEKPCHIGFSHRDIQHNDIQQNNNRNNDIYQNDTQQNAQVLSAFLRSSSVA